MSWDSVGLCGVVWDSVAINAKGTLFCFSKNKNVSQSNPQEKWHIPATSGG